MITMQKALFLGSEANRKAIVAALAAQSFELQRPAKGSWKGVLEHLDHVRYDLVLVELEALQDSFEDLAGGLRKHQQTSMMFMCKPGQLRHYEKKLEPFLANRAVDWISTPVRGTELSFRLKRAKAQRAGPVPVWSVPELRSDDSGRIDAALVAKHFGWTLTQLSRGFGRSLQTVSKTPDAPALQKRLEKLERVALLARKLAADTPSGLRKWLNAPSPDLDGEKPGVVLLQDPDVVLQWLEDAATGHPG